MAAHDEADDRWRDVLFEMVKRAKSDAEFRERCERAGAILDNFEAVLDRVHSTPASEVACRDYWWGFQVEVPHHVLASWASRQLDLTDVTTAIGTVPGPAGPFTRRAAAYIARELEHLVGLDRGTGVHVSMTWMAPNVFVPTTVRR